MDENTLAHLRAWCGRQFENDGSIIAVMAAQYLADPELYDERGWWRCYDDAMGQPQGGTP